MLLGLSLLAVIVPETLTQCLSPNDDRFSTNPLGHRELIRSQLDFSLSLFKTVAQQHPSENIFISPVSIYNTMILAYFTARTHTEQSIHRALFLPNSVVRIITK